MNQKKRRLFRVLVIMLVLLIMGAGICDKKSDGDGEVPGYVMNPNLLSWGDGLCVRIGWEEPEFGSPLIQGYRVYFAPLGGIFTMIADSLTSTVYIHEPLDTLTWTYTSGYYYVTAFNDNGEGDAVDTLNTIPIYTHTLTVGELDNQYDWYSGYGWDRSSFVGSKHTMHLESSANLVDFYISDLHAGWSGEYNLVSPHSNDLIAWDDSVIPDASWRATGIYMIGPYYPSIAAPDTFSYYQSLALIDQGSYYVMSTQDGYYAAVRVTYMDIDSGIVNIDSWFQGIKGLRILDWGI